MWHILREFLCIQTAGPGCSSSSYLAHHVSYLFIHHFMSRFPPQWLLVATRLPRSGKCRLTMSVCVKKPQQFDGLSWHLFFFLSKKYYTKQVKLAILKCGPYMSGQTHVFSYNSSSQHPRCSVKKNQTIGIHRYPEARILAGLVADQLQKWGCIQYVFDPTADSLLTVFFVLALQTLCLTASEEIRSDHNKKQLCISN